MTIKRRLAISNILMIVVPVAITLLTAILCAGLLWLTLVNGNGIGFEDSEDFYNISTEVNELVSEVLETPEADRQTALTELTHVLNRKTVTLVILEDGADYYRYGEEVDPEALAALEGAAEALGYEGTISAQDYDLSVSTETQGGQTYTIFLYSRQAELSYTGLKIAVVLAGCILILAVFLSTFLTSRFLTRFIFRHVEEPLELLTAGVREISNGNLDYRLEYHNEDEFLPVCDSFNEMAVRLKESVERSRREEESRKELMASLSHDLRSPLTSIQAYVEGLLDGVARTPEARQRYLLTIKAKAEELERLVQRILIYSRMELEEVPRDARLLRVDSALCEELSAVSDDYAGRGLCISAELELFSAVADRAELRQILLNIADNSLKYKDRETGHLTVRLTREGGWGVLSFTDDGPGVPEESLPKLFDIFYRTDPARTDRTKGSGLGLAIVRRAAERMGGAVRAEQAAGGGLSIIITLPEGETEHGKNSDH